MQMLCRQPLNLPITVHQDDEGNYQHQVTLVDFLQQTFFSFAMVFLPAKAAVHTKARFLHGLLLFKEPSQHAV